MRSISLMQSSSVLEIAGSRGRTDEEDTGIQTSNGFTNPLCKAEEVLNGGTLGVQGDSPLLGNPTGNSNGIQMVALHIDQILHGIRLIDNGLDTIIPNPSA